MAVALVGTIHGERGLATVESLLDILARFSPTAVYAEVPASYISRYSDGSHGTLESQAVAQYAREREVAVIPVDAPEPGPDFWAHDEFLWTRIENTSPEYRRIFDLHSASTKAGGFRYLNSPECLAAWDALYSEAADTVVWLRDSSLSAIFAEWQRVIAHRDDTMLANILEHRARSDDTKGMLLVGSSHRQALLKKAAAFRDAGQASVQWDIGSFLSAVG